MTERRQSLEGIFGLDQDERILRRAAYLDGLTKLAEEALDSGATSITLTFDRQSASTVCHYLRSTLDDDPLLTRIDWRNMRR